MYSSHNGQPTYGTLSRVATVAIIAAASLIALLWLASDPAPAGADHCDGNIACGDPYYATVNYWIIEDQPPLAAQLRVCDDSSRVSTDVLNGAIGIWNSGVGATMLVSSCSNWEYRWSMRSKTGALLPELENPSLALTSNSTIHPIKRSYG